MERRLVQNVHLTSALRRHICPFVENVFARKGDKIYRLYASV